MDVDIVVVGAGIVGLSCAAALARPGREVLVLERHPRPSQEASSRNSEVLHAGLYYPPGSWKARLCIEGNSLVRARCAARGIGFRDTGKVVVAASPDELPALESLAGRARANGAPGIELWGAATLARAEPRVRGAGALWSPSTAVVDSHALIRSYLAEAEAGGARVACGARVTGVDPVPAGVVVHARDPGGGARIRARAAVLAAGVDTDRLLAASGLDPAALGVVTRPCKGDWFALAPRWRGAVSRLVYPLPPAGGAGLGVHLTLDLAGRIRLGPDATFVDRDAPGVLDVDPAKADAFARAGARYLADLTAADLSPDSSGLRARISGAGESTRDFVLEDLAAAGAPGLVLLAGIDSPGLTAAPAIARVVERLAAPYVS